jgi:UrcA family protein
MNISTTNLIRSLSAATLCVAILSGFTSMPAGAAAFEPLSVTVRYGDLDLSRAAGSTILYNRIRAAAERVCSPLDGGGLAAKTRLKDCIDKAVSDAIRTVPRPLRLTSSQGRLQSSRAVPKL